MNRSLQNLKHEAKLLNIIPFHQITSRAKKGTVVLFKAKTKQELYNEIKAVDPKIRKKLLKLSFENHTINNSGKKKRLVTTQRQGRCPRLKENRETIAQRQSQKKCDDVKVRKDCKFVRKGNQPVYSPACLKHFPCFHKKGYAELNNANNYKHYIQSQNINYRYSPSTMTKRESRQNYGYVPAKNLLILRSHKHKTNLALYKKNNTMSKGSLILLNNGNILEVKKNSNGVLKINKK